MTRHIHRLAASDLSSALRFYRSEAGAGVAQRFLTDFEHAARLLEQHPGLGTPSADDRRIYPLSDFPYSIIYQSVPDGIRILVIRHQNRDPQFGEGRR